jgi:hypothetical protein
MQNFGPGLARSVPFLTAGTADMRQKPEPPQESQRGEADSGERSSSVMFRLRDTLLGTGFGMVRRAVTWMLPPSLLTKRLEARILFEEAIDSRLGVLSSRCG